MEQIVRGRSHGPGPRDRPRCFPRPDRTGARTGLPLPEGVRTGLLSAMTTLREKAELFHSLHRDGAPLVLANVWDVAGARLVEEAGARVVATTSA
ncbi:isocitrate lyase/phosphoenolpyruvate mutase family protein, partial [Streptosporangium algeriense]